MSTLCLLGQREGREGKGVEATRITVGGNTCARQERTGKEIGIGRGRKE